MKTPFTTEQFFGVFEKYNSTVFPAQIIVFILGVVAIWLIHSRYILKNRLIGRLLGLLWIWIGLAYHIAFFASINKAAYVFGGIFVLQGLLFLYESLAKARLEFEFKNRITDFIGYFFILFGLIIYPVISYLLEQSVVRTITLGLPCPSTILTFGFLLLAKDGFPKYLLIIPVIWAIIGTSAAINFGIYQDYMMILAAVVSVIVLMRK